jgi:hypothetical protein
MAFPGTFNISYYKGDTYEFRIYPKDASNAIFDLSDYGNATFKIATSRGQAGLSSQVSGFAQIANDNASILCVITPTAGAELNPGTTYVYDIQIRKPGTQYDLIHTLLTGTITVTDEVTTGTGDV